MNMWPALTIALVAAAAAGPQVPEPRHYDCKRAVETIHVDGRLDDPAWQSAAWTDDFIDIEGAARPSPRYRTRARMLWDDEFFYVAAELQEPHLWATLTERDAVIFHDNDFEVFIDPDDAPDSRYEAYYEIEVNALGTVWDMLLTRPYRDGGQAVDAWDIRDLRLGIALDGTLNDPGDTDRGWTVEMAVPWSVLEEVAPGGRPPQAGDTWRVNFSRVQWQLDVIDGAYVKRRDAQSGDLLREDNWVWSPQHAIDMHRPEHWGFVRFVDTMPQ